VTSRIKLLNSSQLYYFYYLAITMVLYLQLQFAWYIIGLVSNSKLNVMLQQTVTSTHGTAGLVFLKGNHVKKHSLLTGCCWVPVSDMLFWCLENTQYSLFWSWLRNFYFCYVRRDSCVYWTVQHLTSWIKWTNLMSLYESFFVAQHVSNVITFILRSRRIYVGVLFCFGVYWCIGAVRLE
jgi:hypothetical protein